MLDVLLSNLKHLQIYTPLLLKMPNDRTSELPVPSRVTTSFCLKAITLRFQR